MPPIKDPASNLSPFCGVGGFCVVPLELLVGTVIVDWDIEEVFAVFSVENEKDWDDVIGCFDDVIDPDASVCNEDWMDEGDKWVVCSWVLPVVSVVWSFIAVGPFAWTPVEGDIAAEAFSLEVGVDWFVGVSIICEAVEFVVVCSTFCIPLAVTKVFLQMQEPKYASNMFRNVCNMELEQCALKI